MIRMTISVPFVLHSRDAGRLLIEKRYGGRVKGMVW